MRGLSACSWSGEAARMTAFPTEATAEPEGRWALPTNVKIGPIGQWWAMPTLQK